MQQQPQEPTAATVSVSVTTPELGVNTRVFGDGKTAKTLHYAVYNAKVDAAGDTVLTYLPDLTVEDHEFELSTTVDLQLVTGNTYKVIFWADSDDAPYTIHWTDATGAANASVSVDYTDVTSNNEAYDAFFNWMTIVVNASKTESIKLYRPFGQLNIGTNDMKKALSAGYELKETQVTVATYNTLDLWTKEVSGDTIVEFAWATFPDSTKETFPVKVATGELPYYYLAMNYLLLPTDKKLVDVTFDYTDLQDNKQRTFSAVPVRRNWRTNIYGQLLTSDIDVNVEIVPLFVDEAVHPDSVYNVKVWDGHSLTKPQAFDHDLDGDYDEVHVYDGSELAYIANKINGGGQSNAQHAPATRDGEGEKYDANVVIKLKNDIDLGGENWTPIKQFLGTFDGLNEERDENFVISNLKVRTEGKASAGLFAAARNVKNLTIKNADIQGQYKTGVIAGDGLCGKFENCHVENAVVVSTPHKTEEGYDDGNNVGGIVGYLSAEPTAYVKGCTVKNAEITAYRKVGGIVGAANGKSEVTGNTVENVKVTADLTAEYKESKSADAGAIVGYASEKAVVSDDNTVNEGVTVTIKVNSADELNDILKNGHEGDIIEVASGSYDALNNVKNNVTIIGAGYEYSTINPVGTRFYGHSVVAGEGVTIKNAHFANPTANWVLNYQNAALHNITFENCWFNDTEGVRYAYAKENVTFNKCIFGYESCSRGVHFDDKSGDAEAIVTFNECTLYGFQALGGGVDQFIFNDCSFPENTRPQNVVNMYNYVEFNRCSFNPLMHTDCAVNGVTVSFTECSYTDNSDITRIVRFDKDQSTCTVTFDGNRYVAEGLLEDEDGNQVAYSEAGLKEALENGGTVVLANPFTIDQSETNGYGKTGINMTNGGTLDGNGNELGAPGSTGTWDSAINTSGGTIKNLKVTEGFRGIFIKNDSKHNEKLFLDNVTIDGTTYTISCDQGNGLGLEAKNSTFKGWTSYAATLGDAKFTNCYFGKGNGYSYCRPYAPTEFVGCEFEAGFRLDPRAAVTFENCTLDGVALTAANIATLVTNTANVTVK